MKVSFDKLFRSFTLIEVLIVISLIILVSGLSLATYHNFNESAKLNKETERLYNVLNLARQKTLVGDYSGYSCLNFYGYQVRRISISAYKLQLVCNLTFDVNTYNLEDSVNISFSNNPIKFTSVIGHLDGSTDITITITNTKISKSKTIQVKKQGQIILN